MNTERNTTMETVPATRAPQRIPGFDPMKFALEGVNKVGEKVLTLDLKHKKAWFRMACPNGGVVLNPLRVTDQLAIFEARLFADKDDRNPLASFTATRAADKATGKQYIRAAQEDALDEVLENAGFSLQLYELLPGEDSSGQKPVAPVSRTETLREAADGGKSVEPPPVVVPKQAAGDVKTDPKEPAPVKQPKPMAAPAPRPAPVDPPRPAQAAPWPNAVNPAAEKKSPVSTVVDIATRQPVAAERQSAVQREQANTSAPSGVEPKPAVVVETAQVASGADAQKSAAPAYTADMTVEEICQVMTLEQAKALKVKDGTCKGWTLEQVARDRPASLKWFRFACPFADNVLKAASKIVQTDLELKMAG